MKKPTILIYRRSHWGDPNEEGVFGCNDCMGSVRNWSFDAVVGIGGVQPWRGYEGIARKITWIGIGATKIDPFSYDPKKLNRDLYEVDKFAPSSKDKFRGSWVTFEHFLLLNEKGSYLQEIAPKLYSYMVVDRKIPRAGKNLPDELYFEVTMKILPLADKAPPSKGPIQIVRENLTEQENFTRHCKTDAVKVANCGCRK